MNTVEEYANRFEGEKKEWLMTFVSYMRETYPQIAEVISYQIPMYKFRKTYVAFSIAKDHFTFHTLDFDQIEALKERLPRAKFGKGSAKIPFNERGYIPVLKETIDRIMAHAAAGETQAK